jgi:hypothetical protein
MPPVLPTERIAHLGTAGIGEGNGRQFPQGALEADFGLLRSATDDLLNSRRNPFISFHPAGIAVVGSVTRLGIGLGGSFAPSQGLCEALAAQIGKGPMHLPTA